MQHWCWWNRNVANPIRAHGYQGKGRKALMVLKHEVLEQTLLRRTKEQRADDLALPPRFSYLRRDVLDEVEEDFYQGLYTCAAAALSKGPGTGSRERPSRLPSAHACAAAVMGALRRGFSVALAPRITAVIRDASSAAWDYSSSRRQSQVQFSEFVQSGTVLNNYAHVRSR